MKRKTDKIYRGEKLCFRFMKREKENLHLHSRIARHESPHLHNSVEFIYLTEGCLELGMGQELFHMEEGDFAVLFPEVIHHCQVFSGENNKACYLWGAARHFADNLLLLCRNTVRKIL